VEAYVKSENTSGICRIEFFHPQSNSLPLHLLEEIANTISDAGNDETVKVIILSSAGDTAFCAGGNFDELASITTEAEGKTFFSGFAKLINAMRTCSKIIIGRIHGKCAGGGVGVAAACDYAIAVQGADIKLSELALGIGPFVVGPAVERKMGVSAFSQLAIDATNWRSSDWALWHGLYAELHNSQAGMEAAIEKLANTLSKSSPEAMADLKKVIWQGTENWDELLVERAAISGRLVLSEFTTNAISSFKQKSK
jgi:methylglutaconyl-CoA hydratase